MSAKAIDGNPADLAVATARAADNMRRSTAAHDAEGIAGAVTQFEEIVISARLTNDPNLPGTLVNVITALLVQSEECGSDAALNRALDLLDRHEQLLSDPLWRLSYLEKRGAALLYKAQRTGDRALVRQAVETHRERHRAARKGHPQYGACMLNLGVTLLHSSAMADSPRDVDEAVAVLSALKRRPDGSVDRAAVLSSLGNARLNRFLHVRGHDPAELEAALREHAAAVDAVLPGDPQAATFLSDYGIALMRAYEHTKTRDLIEASVARLREAVTATPAQHFRKAERLSNLASALLTLFERTGEPETLDDAIATFRSATGSSDPEHAHYTVCLVGLANALFRRGELRGMMFDFDEAARLTAKVVRDTPQGHANRPSRLAFAALAACRLPGSSSSLTRADLDLTQAAGLLRRDDPELAQLESNHGMVLEALARSYRAKASGAQHLAERAVRLTGRAVAATTSRHSEYTGRLLNFAAASATAARLTGDATALDSVLGLCTAVPSPADPESADPSFELACALTLACRYDLTGDSAAGTGAIEAYQRAAEDTQASIARRLDAACTGADLASRCQMIQPGLELYVLALDLLDRAAWRGIHRRDQERLLARYGTMPSDAAAMAVGAARPETAVEFLERGRGILLDRFADDGADLAQLKGIEPELAGKFEEVHRALNNASMPDVDVEAGDSDIQARPAHQMSEADERSALACRLDRLITQSQSLPECGGLFRPPSFAALHAAVGPGTVAVVNVSTYRCDALILTPAVLRVAPLPALTRQDAEDAAVFFRTRAQRAAESSRTGQDVREELRNKLAWLWDTIAEPVLQDAGITTGSVPPAMVPRVNWCPTGPAVFLPLHAAGDHLDKTKPEAPRTVIDRAESSYLPKLSILVNRQHSQPHVQGTDQPPLIISTPLTPGRRQPSSEDEAQYLQALFPEATHLDDSAATKKAVMDGLRTHTWFHFSLHGATDDHTPTKGGLELHDARLTNQDLSELDLTNALFAFLSACSTHRGSPDLPDESITPGTMLCISGCQNVIATLWPVRESHASALTQQVYDRIVTTGEGSHLRPHNSASALRDASLTLRDEHPDQPDRWSAFVHIGFGRPTNR